MQSRPAGFTFVELMIVMAIIAILAAIAVPNFLEARTRAAISRSYADLAVIKMAVDAYRLETRQYPLNRTAGVANGWDLTIITTPVAYLSRLPLDTFSPGENQPFRYYNGVQVNPERGMVFNPEGEVAGISFAAGLIWGYGPASYQTRPPAQYFVIDEEGLADITPYNPTNGTTSTGDIFMIFP